MTGALSHAEWLNVVVGYMNQLGYVHCLECATGNGERRPHESWTEMRPFNLASYDDECDGCHKRLVEVQS